MKNKKITALLPEGVRRELIGRIALESFTSRDFDSYHHWHHSVIWAIACVQNMEDAIANADLERSRDETINRLDQLPRWPF